MESHESPSSVSSRLLKRSSTLFTRSSGSSSRPVSLFTDVRSSRSPSSRHTPSASMKAAPLRLMKSTRRLAAMFSKDSSKPPTIPVPTQFVAPAPYTGIRRTSQVAELRLPPIDPGRTRRYCKFEPEGSENLDMAKRIGADLPPSPSPAKDEQFDRSSDETYNDSTASTPIATTFSDSDTHSTISQDDNLQLGFDFPPPPPLTISKNHHPRKLSVEEKADWIISTRILLSDLPSQNSNEEPSWLDNRGDATDFSWEAELGSSIDLSSASVVHSSPRPRHVRRSTAIGSSRDHDFVFNGCSPDMPNYTDIPRIGSLRSSERKPGHRYTLSDAGRTQRSCIPALPIPPLPSTIKKVVSLKSPRLEYMRMQVSALNRLDQSIQKLKLHGESGAGTSSSRIQYQHPCHRHSYVPGLASAGRKKPSHRANGSCPLMIVTGVTFPSLESPSPQSEYSSVRSPVQRQRRDTIVSTTPSQPTPFLLRSTRSASRLNVNSAAAPPTSAIRPNYHNPTQTAPLAPPDGLKSFMDISDSPYSRTPTAIKVKRLLSRASTNFAGWRKSLAQSSNEHNA